MVPVAGSAYTYAYATLGEIFAWIIGWDLILEYAMGNAAVASTWSGYFVKLAYSMFGWKLPFWAVNDPHTAAAILEVAKKDPSVLLPYSQTSLPIVFGHAFSLNFPAFIVVALLTWLLVYGIQESAAVMELHRLTVADGEPPKHTRGGMTSWPHRRVSGSPAFPQSEGPTLGLNAGCAKAAERNSFHRSRPRPDRVSRFRKTAQSAPRTQKSFHQNLFPSRRIPFFPDLAPVLHYSRRARHMPHFRYRGIPCSQ